MRVLCLALLVALLSGSATDTGVGTGVYRIGMLD
jgi:hypothetical protein